MKLIKRLLSKGINTKTRVQGHEIFAYALQMPQTISRVKDDSKVVNQFILFQVV